jgi:hypothetical protein
MSQRSGMLKLTPLLGLFSGTEKRPSRRLAESRSGQVALYLLNAESP